MSLVQFQSMPQKRKEAIIIASFFRYRYQTKIIKMTKILVVDDEQDLCEILRFNLQNAYETYLTEQENLKVADRVFKSVSNKYRFGTNSHLELVNASNDVISAQSSYVQAVLTLINAEVELDKFLK